MQGVLDMGRRLVGVIVAVAVCSLGVEAQQLVKGGVPGTLQRTDTAALGREVVTGVYTWDARSHTNWHTHPGEMVGHVIEGSIVVEQEGKSRASYQPGQTFIVAAGVPHDCINEGTSTSRLFVTYIVEKGKALTSPLRTR
jgi:quercetin dioxygenase-like cupin family protein